MAVLVKRFMIQLKEVHSFEKKKLWMRREIIEYVSKWNLKLGCFRKVPKNEISVN
jgi:hypothetical protein